MSLTALPRMRRSPEPPTSRCRPIKMTSRSWPITASSSASARSDKGFAGVTVTNGSGSPRDGLYANYTDEEMQVVRRKEQKKAAFVGEYSAQVFLDYSSSAVKDGANTHVVEDLKKIIAASKPQVIYTHNLADKHDTHVATTLRVIRALRELPGDSTTAASLRLRSLA